MPFLCLGGSQREYGDAKLFRSHTLLFSTELLLVGAMCFV